MEISQAMLLLLLIYSFLWGGFVGATFDACVILRTMIGVGRPRRQYKRLCDAKLPLTKRSLCRQKVSLAAERIAVAIFDLLCTLLGTVGLIVLNYSYNRGNFRAFTVLGALVGVFLYRALLSKLIFCIFEPIVLVIKYVVLSSFLLILYPVIKFSEILIKNVKKITSLYTFTLEKKRKRLYNINGKVFLPKDDGRVVVRLASRRDISKNIKDSKGRTDDGE